MLLIFGTATWIILLIILVLSTVSLLDNTIGNMKGTLVILGISCASLITLIWLYSVFVGYILSTPQIQIQMVGV